jgi:putative cell wall-binding protein
MKIGVFSRACASLALALGATLLGNGLLAGVTPAGATTAPTGSISATRSPPPVASTGQGVAAGSLTINLSASGSLPTGGELSLFATATSGTVHWKGYSISVSNGVSYHSSMAIGNALDIDLGPKIAGQSAAIYVTAVQVTTTGASGHVRVAATLRGVVFTPSTASDGTIVMTPPNAPAIAVSSSSQPKIALGASDASAGNWTVVMSGDSSAGSGWTAGDTLTLTVAPPSGTNCAGNGYLFFAATPTVTLDAISGTSATTGGTPTPTFAASLGANGGCSAGQPNELLLQFSSRLYFDATASGNVKLTISGVRYTAGTTASAMGSGLVKVTGAFSVAPSDVSTSSASNASVQAASSPGSTSPTSGHSGATSSAPSGTSFIVKAETPPQQVRPGAFDASLSPIELLGTSTAPVPTGYVCMSLSAGEFNTSGSAPAVTLVSGNGSASATAQYQAQRATGAATVEFEVTKASTTGGGYEVSGLAVNAPTTPGDVSVKVSYGSDPSCASDADSAGSVTVLTVSATAVTRIYGATPDATAAAELEHQFDAQATACPGRAGDRPVVLAMDARYPDALASAYLASALGTGELLTPSSVLSAPAKNAIQLEGITQVYIVGGPLAVSPGVAQELESMLAYNCGGTVPLTSDGPVHIQVTRIGGTTEYDTAQWVAEYPTAGRVGSLDVAGAYEGTNPRGGSGRYNDTSGNGSPAPVVSSAIPTAVVATGHTFQDAESASVLAYSAHLPILLTTPSRLSVQVSAAVTALGIQQVIVMGGPLAVSDTAVQSLMRLGVSVLRIAGESASGTATELADFEMGSGAGDLGAGWNGSGGVVVARGDFFTDGLAGAVVAAGGGRSNTHAPEPLLLCTSPSVVGRPLSAFLAVAGHTGIDGDAADRVVTLTILGGPDAVSPGIVTTMTRDL